MSLYCLTLELDRSARPRQEKASICDCRRHSGDLLQGVMALEAWFSRSIRLNRLSIRSSYEERIRYDRVHTEQGFLIGHPGIVKLSSTTNH